MLALDELLSLVDVVVRVVVPEGEGLSLGDAVSVYLYWSMSKLPIGYITSLIWSDYYCNCSYNRVPYQIHP